MKEELQKEVDDIVAELFGVELKIELTRPEEQFGDYATNAALQLAGRLGKNPREIAEQLAFEVQEKLSEKVQSASVAGPGFVNIKVSDGLLLKNLSTPLAQTLAGKNIVAEYSDPNPFKVLHAGHLYTTIVGDSISRILESAGAKVTRLNYGGDVGLHVGKCLWGILQELQGEYPEKLNEIPEHNRLEWLSECYVAGNNIYDQDGHEKDEIVALNQKVYEIQASNDRESALAIIYWTCRDWSYAGFKQLYKQLEVKDFEAFIAESDVSQKGIDLVKDGQSKGIFEESDGAIVYTGEKDGLHTRVFINSKGLPTYEAKELGLAALKWQDYHFDKSVIITANDIVEYMKVVLTALKNFYPEVVERTKHLTHGMIKLPGNQKMSSRLGNILSAKDVLDAATEANKQLSGQHDQVVVLGAIKYSFLKQRLGADIIYDPEESVSLEGNSGPYLQYAHARAQSILSKADSSNVEITDLTEGERSLARKISEFNEVVSTAVNDLLPHHICTYLYELAQTFNRFYEKNRVIDDERQAQRLTLVKNYAETLKNGLSLLGITAPDKM